MREVVGSLCCVCLSCWVSSGQGQEEWRAKAVGLLGRFRRWYDVWGFCPFWHAFVSLVLLPQAMYRANHHFSTSGPAILIGNLSQIFLGEKHYEKNTLSIKILIFAYLGRSFPQWLTQDK